MTSTSHDTGEAVALEVPQGIFPDICLDQGIKAPAKAAVVRFSGDYQVTTLALVEHGRYFTFTVRSVHETTENEPVRTGGVEHSNTFECMDRLEHLRVLRRGVAEVWPVTLARLKRGGTRTNQDSTWKMKIVATAELNEFSGRGSEAANSRRPLTTEKDPLGSHLFGAYSLERAIRGDFEGDLTVAAVDYLDRSGVGNGHGLSRRHLELPWG